MVRFTRMAAVALTCLAISGCAGTLTGFLYTDLALPGRAQDLPAGVSHAGAKEGKSCGNSILGLVATGDASIDAARRAGGINNVLVVDHHYTSILGLFATYCTVVRGN